MADLMDRLTSTEMELLANKTSLFDDNDKPKNAAENQLEILEASLTVIEETIEAEELKQERAREAPEEKPRKKPRELRLYHFTVSHFGVFLEAVVFLVLVALGVSFKYDRALRCKNASVCSLRELFGAPLYKWFIWIGLRGPIKWLTFLLVTALSGIVSHMFLMSGNVLMFILTLKTQVRAMFVEVFWLVLWLTLMRSDYQNAKQTGGQFEDVYSYMWRAIVLLIVWNAMSVLRHALKRFMSLKYYHKAHYRQMMTALVHEHILFLLSKPQAHGAKSAGWGSAHFAALHLVSNTLRGHFYEDNLEKQRVLELNARLKQVKKKLISLAQTIVDDKHAEGAEEDAKELKQLLDDMGANAHSIHMLDGAMVTIAMARHAGRKWRERTKRAKEARNAATPEDERHVEDEAFQELLAKKRGKAPKKGRSDRKYMSWASLSGLGLPDADMLKNATKLTMIEDQVRGQTLQVSYLGGDNYKKNLKAFKEENTAIDTSAEARRLGYFLFWNLKEDPTSMEITAKDLERAISSDTDQSRVAWHMLDKDGNGFVSLPELVDRVVEIYRTRKNLARTLLDTETVVQQCFTAVRVVSDIIWIFIAIAIYDPNRFQSTWGAISAGLLSVSFVFGNSVRQIWESAIFLFTMHPFAVGDKIKIGPVTTSVNGDGYLVEKISLNYLKLKRDGNASFVMPMEQVRSQSIYNLTRSGNLWDSFKVYVDMDTTMHQLKPVAQAVRNHIAANHKLFGGLYRVIYTQASLSHKLELTICFDHCHNGVDMYSAAVARTGLLQEIGHAFTKAGIVFTLPNTKAAERGAPDDLNPAHMPMRVDFANSGGVDRPRADGAPDPNSLSGNLALAGAATLATLASQL